MKEHMRNDPPETDPAHVAAAGRWNGTLLKCPGCRLKFPFVAEQLPFELKRLPPLGPGGEPREVPVTHCPQCAGWVNIT